MINGKKDRNSVIIVKWPVKVKKFNIKDPIMKMFVAKYESLIPWQEKVKNENDLKIYIEKVMLKELFDQIDLKKFKKTNKGYFVTENDIGSDLVKNPDRLNLSKNVILKAKEILKVDGFDRARSFITDEINKIKEKSLKSWRRRIKLAFPNEPHFWYLILKPLYDSSPKGSRRLVAGFNKRALEILYNRLKNEEFPPNKNILEAYFDSDLYSALLEKNKTKAGWIFVNSVSSLIRASYFTKWCTKEYGYARSYLNGGYFYILKFKRYSHIAMKIHNSTKSIETCVDALDEVPSEEWYDDIALFTKIMNLKFEEKGLKIKIENHFKTLDFFSLSENWWKERIDIWPFSIKFAPVKIFEKYRYRAIRLALKYSEWEEFENLFKETFGDIDILDYQLWKSLVKVDPIYYNVAPSSIQNDPKIKEICKKKWIEKLHVEGIALNIYRDIPKFVYEDSMFVKTLREKLKSLNFSHVEFKFLPESVWKNKEFTKSLKERSPQALKRFMSFVRKYKKYYSQLNDFLVVDPPDPYYVAVDRLVSILLFEVKDVFYEKMIPEYLRSRDDYQKIRVEGWKKAINKEPFLVYSLPNDLEESQEFKSLIKNEDSDSKVEDLLRRWPWKFKYLKKKQKFNRRFWDACIEGYKKILERHPCRLNIKMILGEYGYALSYYDLPYILNGDSDEIFRIVKTSISPLILHDSRLMDTIINALVKRNKLHLDWKRLPEEFKELLTYQYAFLKAIYKLDKSRKDQEFYCNRSILKVYGEIKKLFYERFNGDYPSSELVNKVLKLIVILGVKYDYYLDPRFSSFRYCG